VKAIREATLHVLAELGEIGVREAVAVPLAAYDPLLRPFIRRRVDGAILEASARTNTAMGEHVLRLAFLLRLREPPPALDPNDPVAVGEAFRARAEPYLGAAPARIERHGPGGYRAPHDPSEPQEVLVRRARRKRWPLTVPLAALSVVSALAALAFYALPYFLPTAEERFLQTAFGVALGDPLTDFVSEERAGGDEAARKTLLSPEVDRQIGHAGVALFAKALDLVPKTVLSDAASTDNAAAPLFSTLNALNAELVKQKVPTLLHLYANGEPGSRSVWLTAYFVYERDEVFDDGERLRFAWGRRIDRLNLLDSAVYKADADDWVVLSLDLAEEEFVEGLLPTMAGQSPDLMDPVRAIGVEAAVGEITRASRLDASDARTVYRALVARNDAAKDLAARGYAIEPSSRLKLAPSLVRAMTRARSRDHDLAPIFDEFLRTNDRMAVYQRQVASDVDEVAKLEEELFATRLVAEKRLASVSIEELAARGLDSVSLRGVSASQLAVLARARDCPRLALWLVVEEAYGHPHATFGTRAVSRLVVEDLLAKLQIEGDVDPGTPEGRKPIAAAFDVAPERVREAAAAVYERLFGRRPPDYRRVVGP
jgi:hypothetical protein